MNVIFSYNSLANLVLFLHFLYILFVVGGFVLIIIGGILRWRWIRNRYFRFIHLISMVFVVLESWFGIECPLTTLENYFRKKASIEEYEKDFIAYWLSKLVYFDAPPEFFIVIYTVFTVLIIIVMFIIPPKWQK